jgi:putative CocE/NonD family hydrolase
MDRTGRFRAVDRRLGCGAAAALVVLLAAGCAGGGDAAHGVPASYARAPDFAGLIRTSHYVTMRDGVRLAVDVILPSDAGAARVPALLYQGRYWRSVSLRGPARVLSDAPERHGDLGRFKSYFVRRGYAWIDVDTRGSGASEGVRLWDYSPEEIADGADLAEWIVRQPWSDGRIAGVGVSYSGAAAELLLANQHPAVKAAVPLFCDFDQYQDILAPGGIPNRRWILAWADYTARLDRGILPSQLWLLRPFVSGVRPVDGPDGRAIRARAIAAHRANFDFSAMAEIVNRDDRPAATFARDAAGARAVAKAEGWLAAEFGPRWRALGTDLASPHAFARQVDAAGAPEYAYSGWLDGGYARAAAQRFATLQDPRNRLLLGPWDHALQAVSPRGARGPSRFDHSGELLRFLDEHVKGLPTGLAREPRVHYFTIGAEEWRAADRWPPPSTPARWYAAAGGALAAAPPEGPGEDVYLVDFGAGTGPDSRWGALRGRPIGAPYGDRAAQDERLLVYTSPPLAGAVEVTGHPVVTVHVASTATDGAFFAYLEEVSPDGDVTYVTEGSLRARHRRVADAPDALGLPRHTFRRADAMPLVPGEVAELTFDLHPISYRFAAGGRIRLALAGADADHFARIPSEGPVAWRVQRSVARPTSLVLPVVAPAAPSAR